MTLYAVPRSGMRRHREERSDEVIRCSAAKRQSRPRTGLAPISIKGLSPIALIIGNKTRTLRGHPARHPRKEVSAPYSESEAQPGRGIDVVALEITVRQSAIHLREHDADIGVPLRRKPPIDNGRYRVERSGTLRVSAARAADVWPGREKVVLGIMIITTDHIQFIGGDAQCRTAKPTYCRSHVC